MGLISTLFSNPTFALLSFFALIVSIGFHEFSHVFVAYVLGDNTGKAAGRLTLNPLAHLSPLGTLMILFIGVGYGKPAPFTPSALRYQRFGPTFVALGGPLSNILLVAVFGGIWRLVHGSLGGGNLLVQFLSIAVFYNAALAVFNLIPIAPLDGSHLLRSILGGNSPIVRTLEHYGWQLLFGLIALDFIAGVSILGTYISWGVGLVLRLFGLT